MAFLQDVIGFRWLSLVFVGLRWFSLVSVGFVGFRWFPLVFVGVRWFSLGFVGVSAISVSCSTQEILIAPLVSLWQQYLLVAAI